MDDTCTVRVFISSTFRDMHAERDHLVTVVFPELRERVESLGLEFFDVDLRWGVPAKDANGETANSWEYCRQWIDRVEPFFVCILGQRYGWVPEVEDLKQQVDRERQAAKPRSITDLEARYAVLDGRRKRHAFFYLRQTEVPPPDPADAAAVALAGEYVDPPALLERLARLKADVRACERPVRDYTCAWTTRGFTGLEGFGHQVLEDLWSGVLRDERYVSADVWRQVLGADPETDVRYADESQPVPRELWERIVALAKPAPKDPLDAEREAMDAFAVSRLRWFQGRQAEIRQLTNFLDSTEDAAPRLAVVAALPGQGKSALLARLHEDLMGSPHLVITHFVGATEQSASAHALVRRLLDELDRGMTWPMEEPKAGEEPKEEEEPKRDFNSLCLRLADRLGDYAGERRIILLLDALNQLTDGHDLRWLPTRLGPGVRVVASCIEDAAKPADSPEGQTLQALLDRRPARVAVGPLADADAHAIVVAYLREYCKELDPPHIDAICAMPPARNPLYLLVMLGELRTLGGNDMNRLVGERIAALQRDYPDTVSLFRWVLQRLEVFGAEAVQWWCLYLAHGRTGMASHELADLLARKLGADAASTALLIERGLRRYLLRRGAQLDFFHGQLRQAVVEQYGPRTESPRVHRDMAEYFTDSARGGDPAAAWDTESVRGFAECVYHHVEADQHHEAGDLLTSFPFLLYKLRAGLLEGVFEDFDMMRREAPAEAAQRLEIWADFFSEKAHILRRGNEKWPAHKILLQLAIEHADDSPLTHGAEQWLAEDRCEWFWLRRVPRVPLARKNPCIAVFEGHTGAVNGARVLTDGHLLSWSYDKTLRIWDVLSGKCLSVLEGHTGGVNGAIELSDGRLLSWAGKDYKSDDTSLRIWNRHTGACLAVLEGHMYRVLGAIELSDGRLVSWAGGERSNDNTLRIWDSRNGQCLHVLEGHTDGVNGAIEVTGGRLLSWAGKDYQSNDNLLRLWDSRTGKCLMMLEAPDVTAGALELSDGRLLSWAKNSGPQVWDSRNGKIQMVLEGFHAQKLTDDRILTWGNNSIQIYDNHSGACLTILEEPVVSINGALILNDGRLLSWGTNSKLRIYDGPKRKRVEIHTGHTDKIAGVLELTNGRIVSWTTNDSRDITLRISNVQTGACLAVLSGHTGEINGALVLSDGRLLSWSDDDTLRVWDSNSRGRQYQIEGHTARAEAIILKSGQILSWGDSTLRIWNSETGICQKVLEGHEGVVAGALELSDGRLLSWGGESQSEDHTLRVWNTQSGQCLLVLEGHTECIGGVLELSKGQVVTWTGNWLPDYDKKDHTLHLWDSYSGKCLKVLQGHTDVVSGALRLSDGRLLSWTGRIVPGTDTTLRVWDSRSGKCLKVLKGHTDHVSGACELSNGHVVSWTGPSLPADDYSLRVWNSHSGHCLKILRGHEKPADGAMEIDRGQILSRSTQDHTYRLWEVKSGKCLEVIPLQIIQERYLEWEYTQRRLKYPGSIIGNYYMTVAGFALQMYHKNDSSILAAWNADASFTSNITNMNSLATNSNLMPNGTVVSAQNNGKVCILQLYYGRHRISISSLHEIAELHCDPTTIVFPPDRKADESQRVAVASPLGYSNGSELETEGRLCELNFSSGKILSKSDLFVVLLERNIKNRRDVEVTYLITPETEFAHDYEFADVELWDDVIFDYIVKDDKRIACAIAQHLTSDNRPKWDREDTGYSNVKIISVANKQLTVRDYDFEKLCDIEVVYQISPGTKFEYKSEEYDSLDIVAGDELRLKYFKRDGQRIVYSLVKEDIRKPWWKLW